MEVNFESILKEAGELGPWQIRLYLLIGLNGFFMAFQHLGAMFLAATPDHWCAVPDLPNNANWTDAQIKSLTLPTEIRHGITHYSQCFYYDQNYSLVNNSALVSNNNGTSALPVLPCDHWEFDHSQYESTIVTQWGLVCDWKALKSTVQGSYMAGVLFGCIIFGFIADRWGRRKAVLIAQIIFISSAIATAFSPHYIVFILLRFLVALAAPGIFAVSFVVVTEIIGPQWRSLLGICYQIPFGVGYAILPGLAYLLRDWTHLQMAMSLPSIVLLSSYWFLPESPRWLITQGRYDEALEILRKCAKRNGRSLGREDEILLIMSSLKKKAESEEPQSKRFLVSGLCRTLEMRKRTACAYFTWFVVALVYYGLALNSPTLGGDPYLVVFFGGLLETPAYGIGYWLVHHVGRRKSYSATFILAAIICFAILPVPHDITWLSSSLAVAGKFVITITFGISYLYTAELFPTEVRSMAVTLGSMCARIGSIASPFIVDLLGYYHKVIPLIVFGVLGLTAGLLSLFLPETNNANLAEMVDDVQAKSTKPTVSHQLQQYHNNSVTSVNSITKNSNVGKNEREKTRL